MPASFKEMGIDEASFMGSLDMLTMRAFEDQCAPANPRIPMIAHMEELMIASYYGIRREDVQAQRAAASAQPAPAAEEPAAEEPAEAEAAAEELAAQE